MRPIVVDWLARVLPYDVAAALAPGWFTMVGLAGLVTLLWMMRIARRHHIDPGIVATAVLWCYVAAVAAGILVPMLLDAIIEHASTGRVHLHWAGMTSFWGYLAGTAAVVIVCRDHGVPLARFGDLCVAPLGIALALSRTGCFLAGCDYGKVSSLPWAVRFPIGSPAWHDQVAAGLVPASRAASLPVQPTELYEALLGVAICIVGVVGIRRMRRDGNLFLAAVAVYCAGRIGIEIERADVGRGIYAGLSSGQIFSILVLVALAARALVGRVKIARLAGATAVVGALVVVGAPAHADAQPAPAQQQQQPPPQPQPQPQPYPQPQPQPYPQPQPQPYPYPQQPYPYPYPPQQPAATYPPPGTRVDTQGQPGRFANARFAVGLLGGGAVALNRRSDQVPALAGYTLSAGLVYPSVGVWLDFDSYGNRDASHGTLLVSGSWTSEVSDALSIGGRVGLGGTLVNFKDPVFRDAGGTDFRAEAVVEYALGGSFALWVRPVSLDVLASGALGGPILTWQVRAGVAFTSKKPAKPASTQQARNP